MLASGLQGPAKRLHLCTESGARNLSTSGGGCKEHGRHHKWVPRHGRLHLGWVEEPCGHGCAGACASLEHPWCCRSPAPPKAIPPQMGEEHLQVGEALARWGRDTRGRVQARRATFARMGFLCSCCPGNLNGSLSGLGVCVPTPEKMEQRQMF